MKNMRKAAAMVMALLLVIGMQMNIMVYAAEDSGYTVTFAADHATVDVYYTQDYTAADETGVTTAYARNSDTGEIDTSGDGQVNFLVRVEDGYTLESISADANYKNLKGQADTGVENLYRLTKITGDVTVTITTTKNEDSPDEPDEPSGYKVTFNGDHAAIDVYYTQDYTAANETDVTTAFARDSDTGEVDTSGDGQVNFLVRVEDGYTLESVSADKNYKNLKGQADTGVENLYRLTKITGDVTVTITTTKNEDSPDEPDEPSGYKVTFNGDHAAIDIYYTQDYTAADETGVTTAYARNSDTGEVDTSGDGQVNFLVRVEDGYTLESVSADTNYKNLKDSADTGVENLYRLTKITGDVTVTIKAVESAAAESTIKLNEVNSSPDDWVELINIGTETVDLSGYEIRDNANDHRWKFADGAVIEAGAVLLVDGHTEGLIYNDTTGVYEPGEFQDAFGLGAGDSVRLYDSTGTLTDSYSWTEHASYAGDAAKASYGRYPDGTGSFVLMPETPGEFNGQPLAEEPPQGSGAIDAIAWPGPDTLTVSDLVFLEDSSGLDFANGKLYAIDNGTATLWVINVAKDGSLSLAEGYESGKQIRFRKDAENPSAAGPDTEGVTVDGSGYVYAASERDNSEKGVNFNSILMVDPNAEGTYLVAIHEWDLTNLLPAVSANMGIEAVEWVSNADVEDLLYDENTQSAFQASNYPNAVASGVFFVALEDNGHVYAFVLNEDESAILIADIDSGIGGAMALDYDTYENVLWVAADNGFDNISAKVSLNGTSQPGITYVSPAKGLDSSVNYEGFAIAGAEFTVDGLRAVYHFADGVKTGALAITYLSCEDSGDTDPSDGPEDPAPDNTDPSDGPEDPAGDTPGSGDAADNSGGNPTASAGETSPKTGDSFRPAFWIVLMLLSFSGIAYILIANKKARK